MKPLLPLLALLLGLASIAMSQDNDQTPPCSMPEARQFDFWVGQWVVTANGKQVGTNRIASSGIIALRRA